MKKFIQFLIDKKIKNLKIYSEGKLQEINEKNIQSGILTTNETFCIKIMPDVGGVNAVEWANKLKGWYPKNINNIPFKYIHLFKNEEGYHKFIEVRKNDKRQTSLVRVSLIFNNDIEINFDDKDFERTKSRSSGAGGQNVNKRNTKSVIIYKPLGIYSANQESRLLVFNESNNLENLKSKICNYANVELNKMILKSLNVSDKNIRIYYLKGKKIIIQDKRDKKLKDINQFISFWTSISF